MFKSLHLSAEYPVSTYALMTSISSRREHTIRHFDIPVYFNALNISNSIQQTANWKSVDSSQNDNKHSLTAVCCDYLLE